MVMSCSVHALEHNRKNHCKGISLLASDNVFAPTVYFIHLYFRIIVGHRRRIFISSQMHANEIRAKCELRYEKLRRH